MGFGLDQSFDQVLSCLEENAIAIFSLSHWSSEPAVRSYVGPVESASKEVPSHTAHVMPHR